MLDCNSFSNNIKITGLKQRSDSQVSGASFLAPENLRKLHVHNKQVFCSRKWVSDLQSIVQSAAEFHDRNLPEIEHVLFAPVSGASFFVPENGSRNPVHTGKFSGARNLRQKLVPETCQSERGLTL